MYSIGLFQIRLSIFFYFLLSSGTNRRRTLKNSRSLRHIQPAHHCDRDGSYCKYIFHPVTIIDRIYPGRRAKFVRKADSDHDRDRYSFCAERGVEVKQRLPIFPEFKSHTVCIMPPGKESRHIAEIRRFLFAYCLFPLFMIYA